MKDAEKNIDGSDFFGFLDHYVTCDPWKDLQLGFQIIIIIRNNIMLFLLSADCKME